MSGPLYPQMVYFLCEDVVTRALHGNFSMVSHQLREIARLICHASQVRDDAFRLHTFVDAQEYQEVGGDIIDMTNEGVAAKYDLGGALLVDVQESFAEIRADKPMGVPRFILLESFY